MTDYLSFTIVIPTYQRRAAVCAAVLALAKVQYRGPVELIVVVDGSTDATAQALAAIDCPFSLRIIEQPNSGAAAARNRGAAEASGDILLFLDDDMVCEPDIVEQHVRMYREGADAVIGDFPIHADVPSGFLSEFVAEKAHWDRQGKPLTPFDVFTGQLSVRRSVFEELGGFDESFTANGNYGNEDLDFGARLLERHDLRHNPQAVCHQRTAVGPRQYMRRAASLARADIRLAQKHPQLGRALFEQRGIDGISNRLRLLSRMPLVPDMLAAVAVFAAELGLKSRFRSSRKLAYLFMTAWLVKYWSVIQPDRNESTRAGMWR